MKATREIARLLIEIGEAAPEAEADWLRMAEHADRIKRICEEQADMASKGLLLEGGE